MVSQIRGTTKTETERTIDISGHLATVLSATLEMRRTASARVVTMHTAEVPGGTTEARARGPWLYYPAMGPTPTRRDEPAL